MNHILSLTVLLFLFSHSFAQKLSLGKIDFPNSGAEAAQTDFYEGVLLLHSFEYEDAAEAFQRAQKIDPDFALAYWGEAMTHTHPLWSQQDRDAALAALDRLAPTPEARLAKAPTKKEKDLLQAVHILYGEGTKEERDYAYSDFMGRLHKKYPDDHEITSFYALSILGTCHEGRDEYRYIKAGSIVEEVYSENPEHPGALHYLIHSYDDPVHAPLGLRAARRYAEVAPSAAHALHMPSHIFIALGMWDRVVRSNEESSAAADTRRLKKDLGVDARGFHSLHWLEYGYLQQGRITKAKKLLQDMQRDYRESDSRRSAFHLAVMRASYLVETEDWKGFASQIEVDHERLAKKAKALDLFIQSLAALRHGKDDAFEKHLKVLESMAPMHEMHDMSAGSGMLTCCSPNYTEDDEGAGTNHAIHVMTMELKACKLFQDGKKKEAIDMLEKAADMEGRMDFMFGPPIIAKPSHELLGEFLLAEGEYKRAAKAFELGLKRAPKRTRALLGLYKAAQGMEDETLAQETKQQIQENLRKADQGLDWFAAR